jgi:hypothetical protein
MGRVVGVGLFFPMRIALATSRLAGGIACAAHATLAAVVLVTDLGAVFERAGFTCLATAAAFSGPKVLDPLPVAARFAAAAVPGVSAAAPVREFARFSCRATWAGDLSHR